MKTFKFLTETQPTQYDGEWSQKAIRIVANFVSTRFTSGQRVITQEADYIITETTYNQGELSRAVVKVYPRRDTNMIVTFWISMGRVTPYITEHSVVYEEGL